MWRYVATRLLIMLPTLFGAVTLTFVVTQFVPGGPLDQILLELQRDGTSNEEAAGGGGASYTSRRSIDPAQVEELNRLYGFDKPVLARYWDTLTHFARFDLGKSYFRQESVWELIRSKLPVSITLGLWTLLITYLVSVPLGVAKAVRAGSRFDMATSVLVLTGYAIPGFVLGIVLLVLFGGGTFWTLFPLRGLTSDNFEQLSPLAKVFDYLWHIVLPITASVVSQFAIKTMLTKNSFMDEIHKQYVLTARAKGLSERSVLWKHVFRNALIPLVTGLPAAFIAAFFTNSLLIETLFSLDGLGLLSFEAVKRRDYAVVLGALYLFTLIGLFAKLAGDICYMLVDPRIKLQAGGAR